MPIHNKQEMEGNHELHIIGVDASGVESLSLSLQKIILSARRIAAPTRLLESLPEWWKKNHPIAFLPEFHSSDKPKELIAWLKSKEKEKTVVISGGDPLWFGIGRLLLENFPKENLNFYPSPISLQLAFSKLKYPWQEASWISLHGRDHTPLAKTLQKRPKALGILTDANKQSAQVVRQYLRTFGLENNYTFWICERLGHKEELIYQLKPDDAINKSMDPLSLIVLIESKPIVKSPNDLPLFGIEDGLFIQHEDRPGLMTKREVRVQILADLELPQNGILWDIGAGVGSVSLEALRIRPEIKLLAIEKRIGGGKVIKANAKRLGVNPYLVLEENALDLIKNDLLPKELQFPDRVLLGGGVKKNALLEEILKRLKKGGLVVIPLANIEAFAEVKNILISKNYSISINQIFTSRGIALASGTRLSPMNPVFILKGKCNS